MSHSSPHNSKTTKRLQIEHPPETQPAVDQGAPCKCRIDYLKPRTLVDLKKCANVRERPFDTAVMLTIAEYRYDISAAHNLDGYRYLYKFAAEDRIFGNRPLKRGWHTHIVPPDDMRFTWVFHQTEGAPVAEICWQALDKDYWWRLGQERGTLTTRSVSGPSTWTREAMVALVESVLTLGKGERFDPRTTEGDWPAA
jgi:hypothetical protein